MSSIPVEDTCLAEHAAKLACRGPREGLDAVGGLGVAAIGTVARGGVNAMTTGTKESYELAISLLVANSPRAFRARVVRGNDHQLVRRKARRGSIHQPSDREDDSSLRQVHLKQRLLVGL
jgi:hypothetical protein